jgi:hypothetical protein
MGVTIRDASLTTARRKQLALYAWRGANQYPENPQTVRKEQGGTLSAGNAGFTGNVPTEARLAAALIGQTPGACPCSSAVTLQGYDKKSPAC